MTIYTLTLLVERQEDDKEQHCLSDKHLIESILILETEAYEEVQNKIHRIIME